jgi:hypothetical protein
MKDPTCVPTCDDDAAFAGQSGSGRQPSFTDTPTPTNTASQAMTRLSASRTAMALVPLPAIFHIGVEFDRTPRAW